MAEQTTNKKQKRKLKKRKILRKVAKRTLRNKQIMKKIKVMSKNIKKTIASLVGSNSLSNSELQQIQNMIGNFYKEVDRAVSKGVMHKNEAARRKSRITKYFNNVLSKK
ncbi:MAG: 30S ribosomal protein S20 [bacterium]